MVVCLQSCYIVLSAVAERAGVAACFVASCLLAWRLCDRLTFGGAWHLFCAPQRCFAGCTWWHDRGQWLSPS